MWEMDGAAPRRDASAASFVLVPWPTSPLLTPITRPDLSYLRIDVLVCAYVGDFAASTKTTNDRSSQKGLYLLSSNIQPS